MAYELEAVRAEVTAALVITLVFMLAIAMVIALGR
jgi:hypothetical protein